MSNYVNLLETFIQDKSRHNFYRIFTEQKLKYSEVLSDLAKRGVPKPVRQLGKGIDKALENLPDIIARYLNGETTGVISRDYTFSRTSLNDVLRCLGILRSPKESRALVVKSPEFRDHVSERAKEISQKNIELYGSAVVFTDPETGLKRNVSKTSYGKLKQKQISEQRLSVYGCICPVTLEDGSKVHAAKTQPFRDKAFKVNDPELGFVNYRKTAKGRLEASITRSEYNLKSEVNKSEYDLYLIETEDEGFKVGISHDFSLRCKAYFNNSNFKPKRVRVCRCYQALTHEHAIKVLTIKYGVKYFDYGITGTSEWRNLSSELIEDVERYIQANNLLFIEVYPSSTTNCTLKSVEMHDNQEVDDIV